MREPPITTTPSVSMYIHYVKSTAAHANDKKMLYDAVLAPSR